MLGDQMWTEVARIGEGLPETFITLNRIINNLEERECNFAILRIS